MRARVLAAVLVLAALAVHAGLTSRYRAQASAAADEFRQVRDERRRVASRLTQKQRLADAQRRAGRLPSTETGLTPARAARLSVVRTLEGSGVSRVRLGVSPALKRPDLVNVHVKGAGTFEDVVRFSGAVARPGTGLLLQVVELDTQDQRVALSLEALGLGRP